ncbi:hypothetical protein [Natronoglycomyces albus]|uniref:Uncharacterized protein n=1 Tax=Natronoglycomyces albus TaxID=2811108 RepID=A0A895XJF9_9ACTN|nr:hypothetical protein [Natronoglycomyces albus]QSB05474.1 hypothetical protein JQS30_00575 [Natronoglycomyces albus]
MAKKDLTQVKNDSKVKVVPDGHLPVGEFTSAHIGGSSPFGENVKFPMQVSKVRWEHSKKVGPRILDEERH